VEKGGSGVVVALLKLDTIKDVVDGNHLVRWIRSKSPWIFTFGLACCAIELMAFGTPRFDGVERFGMLTRATPRQADVMIVSGWVTEKMAPVVKRLYEQMPAPKYVIAMGECAISGGPWYDSYNVIDGVDRIIPVDVYVPGCPPRPEALLDGIVKLRRMIREGKTRYDQERRK
jgi:NADH-quinone oxidoreductase subunit B